MGLSEERNRIESKCETLEIQMHFNSKNCCWANAFEIGKALVMQEVSNTDGLRINLVSSELVLISGELVLVPGEFVRELVLVLGELVLLSLVLLAGSIVGPCWIYRQL